MSTDLIISCGFFAALALGVYFLLRRGKPRDPPQFEPTEVKPSDLGPDNDARMW